jgi:peptidoglycan/LPS O-acetylase OafA/YrhL
MSKTDTAGRIPVLDGWRGISILCVLAGHLLPLGPKFLNLNGAIATVGMSLFFTLSGFLMVSILAKNDHVPSFLIHRFCRILPLAWLYLAIVLLLHGAGVRWWITNFLFYANLPPFYLTYEYDNLHFWSLCIEMQFYCAIALVALFMGRQGLLLVPLACLAITALRVSYGVDFRPDSISMITWFRVDEILAGGVLALVRLYAPPINIRLPFILLVALFLLLVLACHAAGGPLNYLRPYIAASLIGSTLMMHNEHVSRFLSGKVLGYLATISFALYVLHGLAVSAPFQMDDKVMKYAVRLPAVLGIFLLAHLSTKYYEKPWLDFGRSLTDRIRRRVPAT